MIDGAIGDHEIVIWQLTRIHAAAAHFREKGGNNANLNSMSWWEPGSVWSAEKPAYAMDFTAFQIGVTIREIGGLAMVSTVLAEFADKSGRAAAGWLAGIWADLQPDQELRLQFLMPFEMNGTDTQ